MALKEVLRVSLEYGNPCIQSGRLGTFRELEKLGRIWMKEFGEATFRVGTQILESFNAC